MRNRNYKMILCLLFVAILVCVSGNAYAGVPAVFQGLANKTGAFANGLRNLAYVISGFGIIMFTFLAICGKINFKHLGYIVLCLFFLSGVASLITYTSNQKNLSGLKDGNYRATLNRNSGQLSGGRGSSL